MTFALTQKGSAIGGFAVLRRDDQPTRYYRVFDVGGSVDRGTVDLSLTPLDRGDVSFKLRGSLEGDGLSGTVNFSGDDRHIALRRFRPRPGDAVGTWVLSSRSGTAAEAARFVRDTLITQADGLAWRSRSEEPLTYATPALWSRRGDWLVLEQVVGASYASHFTFPPPFLDSLRVAPGELLRTTRGLLDGSTVVEHFVRASPATGVAGGR